MAFRLLEILEVCVKGNMYHSKSSLKEPTFIHQLQCLVVALHVRGSWLLPRAFHPIMPSYRGRLGLVVSLQVWSVYRLRNLRINRSLANWKRTLKESSFWSQTRVCLSTVKLKMSSEQTLVYFRQTKYVQS